MKLLTLESKSFPNRLLDKWQDEIPLTFLETFIKYGEEEKAIIVQKEKKYNIFTTGEHIENGRLLEIEKTRSLHTDRII